MAFQLENDGTEQQGGTLKIANGVFAQRLAVKSIEDKSSYPGKEKNFFKSGKETELYFIVTCFRDDGKEKTLHLMGKFKRDEVTGKVKAWDTFNNGVMQFMVRVNKNAASVEDDFSISPATLKKYEGQEFISVRYCSGTYQTDKGEFPSFTDWRVFPPNATIEEIQSEWNISAQYLSKYQPEIYNAWSQASRQAEGHAEGTGTSAPISNNDLPF